MDPSRLNLTKTPLELAKRAIKSAGRRSNLDLVVTDSNNGKIGVYVPGGSSIMLLDTEMVSKIAESGVIAVPELMAFLHPKQKTGTDDQAEPEELPRESSTHS